MSQTMPVTCDNCLRRFECETPEDLRGWLTLSYAHSGDLPPDRLDVMLYFHSHECLHEWAARKLGK